MCYGRFKKHAKLLGTDFPLYNTTSGMLKFPFQSIMFVFILADVLLPILTAIVARSDLNQYASQPLQPCRRANGPTPKNSCFITAP